jgi:hypothetical protein
VKAALIVVDNNNMITLLRRALVETLGGDVREATLVFTSEMSLVGQRRFSMNPPVIAIGEVFFAGSAQPSETAGIETIEMLEALQYKGRVVYYGMNPELLQRARALTVGGKPVVVLDVKEATATDWAKKLIELEPRLTRDAREPASH